MARTVRLRSWALFIAPLWVSACASYAPNASMVRQSGDQIRVQLGEPGRIIPQERGQVIWVYPRGPYGFHTYFLYFDIHNKLVAYEQVLKSESFAKIVPGMTQYEVERHIGPSRIRYVLARERGEVHSYRFETPFCDWFQVEYTPTGVVRAVGFSVSPECRGGSWDLLEY
ncbi:MAG: hypothetical protein ACO3I1_08785 [Burkholderiales bacterium]